MGKYVLYAHDGSGNHGCEALVRSTAKLLNVDKSKLVLISKRPNEEEIYGTNEICTIVKRGACSDIKKNSVKFIKAYMELKLKHSHKSLDRLAQLSAIGANKGDIAMSIGGDTYCYGGFDEIIKTNDMLKYGGLKLAYWGCSIEPELLKNPTISSDIKRYDLITARETISYNALKEVNPNTILVSDSAFVLDEIRLPLPSEFQEGNTVGINISPLIMKFGSDNNIVFNNYVRLIEHILENTNMSVCIIPHVVWERDNDLVPCKCLFEMFNDSKRVSMVNDCGAREIKGYISRCRFLIASRTHASIAAYSTGVPTVVVGYSVKSHGIAKDLFGTEDDFVIDASRISRETDLIEYFEWISKHEIQIKEKLHVIMPEYRNRVYEGVKFLNNLK